MKPILFSGTMVCAILAGQKTMTRRVINPQPFDAEICHGICTDSTDKKRIGCAAFGKKDLVTDYVKPAYRDGDILWVRETWRVGAWDALIGEICVDYKADGFADPEWRSIEEKHDELFERLWIQSCDDARAAGVMPDERGEHHWPCGNGPTRWRPSIFMPKEAARIFLRVTAVRAERLQDITQQDAIREGMMVYDGWETPEYDEACATAFVNQTKPPLGFSPRQRFEHLWDKLNKKRGFGWDTNPWVWVYEFERIPKE